MEKSNLYELIKIQTWVAVDIETTGLNADPQKGEVAHILEVGAVKIRNGKISEKFGSLCACPIPLNENIIRLTGISDVDLVGQPSVNGVLKQLHAFCDGNKLVGHNLAFDLSFLKHYGAPIGLKFDMEYIDTYLYSRSLLKGEISDYKLLTLAKYFDFKFTYHRAIDAAEITAMIFLQLAKTERFFEWINSMRELD